MNRSWLHLLPALPIALLFYVATAGPAAATPPVSCGPNPLWTGTASTPVTAAATFSSEFGPDLTFIATGSTVTARDNATGNVAWTRTLAAPIVGSPVPTLLRFGFQAVFVTVSNGDVVRLDLNNGTVQWTQNLRRAGCPNDGLAATPAIQRWDLSTNPFQIGVPTDLVLVATRYVCAPANQNRFYALRADTGLPFWTFNNPAAVPIDQGTEGPTVDYALNRAYFGTGPGGGAQPTTWAVSSITGAQAWAVPAGGMLARPTLRGNRLYMANQQGQVIAMNTANGNPFWNAPITTTSFVGTPWAESRVPFDQYVVLRGANGTLFALQDTGPAPVPAWSTNFTVGASSSPTGAGDAGLIYTGLTDGRVVELDLVTGAIRASRNLGGGAVNAAPGIDRDSGGPGRHELVASAGAVVQRYCLPFVNPILSRQQAIDAALCTVINPNPLNASLVGFLLHRTGPDSVLQAGQTVSDWDNTFTRVMDDETYLFWLDLLPAAFWAHPAQFVFMDARTGAVELQDALTWPVVDGVQQNQLTFDGNDSPDKIHGDYTGVSSSYFYTPVTRPPQNGWGIVVTGMNLVTSGTTDGPAIAGDAARAVEILNGVDKGPKLPPGNITVVNTGGGGNTGATNAEICAAFEGLPRDCAKLHVYFAGHGTKENGGAFVTRGADGKPDRLPWSMVRDKILATGAKEVCIVLMACYSGTAVDDLNLALNPPGGKGPKIQIKGGLSTSSGAGQPTDRDPDGSPFMKAMLACWKDCAADLDNNHHITQFEAQAWAIANNATVAGRGPKGQGLGGCAVQFAPPTTQRVSSSADGGGSLSYEMTSVYFKGAGKAVSCRGTLYVNNTSGSPHNASKSVQIICLDALGRPIGSPMILTPQQLSLPRNTRRCITPLDPNCKSIVVKKYPEKAGRDIRPESAGVPNSRAASSGRSAYYRAGDFLLEEFQALGATGQTLSATVTPVNGWNVSIDPPLPLTLPSWMDTVEVIFRADIPDTATRGARLKALVRNLTTQDSLCLEVQALVYDSLDAPISAGQTHVLTHIEAYGGMSVAAGSASVLDGIIEMRANAPCRVQPGGALTLRDTAVEPGPGIAYTMEVRGALDWQGATLVAPADGLRLFSPPATIFRGGVVNSGGDGVYATGNQDSLDFSFFVIDSTAANGLVLDGVSNCLMRYVDIAHSGAQDVVLKNGAVADLRDCTFDPARLAVEVGSTLTRSWSTNIIVSSGDGDPIVGVPVRVVDALGDTVASGYTGPFGFFSSPLISAVHQGAVTTQHNPHQIRIAAAGVDTTILYSALNDVTLDVVLPVPTSGVEQPPPIQLAQNTPNPFATRTTIYYRLLEPGHVTLQLFDLSGHLLRRLLDRPQEAGDQSYVLSAEGLAPGVYFYRLQCGAAARSRKLVLRP